MLPHATPIYTPYLTTECFVIVMYVNVWLSSMDYSILGDKK
jgi:hypothetical protein